MTDLSPPSGDESGEPDVLTNSWTFSPKWLLSDGRKLIVPVPAGSHVDASLARGWQAARRTSHDNGERLREPLLTAFGQVFSLLEDYSTDLELKDLDDLSDQELGDAVREIMQHTEGF
ncbi:hypothetical protein G3I76_64955 [Streptomyces sp. SID11233]|nr:hypothetical protein [Streptomyces sp. SID11233]